MVSCVLSGVVCAVCVILLPAVLADYCYSYTDVSGHYHDEQSCSDYCCGTCGQMSCCEHHDRRHRITEEEQQYCSGSYSNSDKRSKLATLLGSILGSVLPILLCVGLVICCVAPLLPVLQEVQKRTQWKHKTHPCNDPPHTSWTELPLRNPGYSPVPAQPGFGGLPNPAPPPYNPGFTPGQPMYPLVPPSQPGGFSQPPYNPSYPVN